MRCAACKHAAGSKPAAITCVLLLQAWYFAGKWPTTSTCRASLFGPPPPPAAPASNLQAGGKLPRLQRLARQMEVVGQRGLLPLHSSYLLRRPRARSRVRPSTSAPTMACMETCSSCSTDKTPFPTPLWISSLSGPPRLRGRALTLACAYAMGSQ